jgi:hypothetical protein
MSWILRRRYISSLRYTRPLHPLGTAWNFTCHHGSRRSMLGGLVEREEVVVVPGRLSRRASLPDCTPHNIQSDNVGACRIQGEG